MSEKHSIASKIRWARLSPKERSAKMRAAARARWDKASVFDKYFQSMKMVAGRQKKRQLLKDGKSTVVA